MGEIIIPNPHINDSWTRRHAHTAGDCAMFMPTIDLWGLTAQSHPKVVELCAGDGPWAKAFADAGWNPQDITCIDIARTNTPLIDGAKWLHWDLDALAQGIIEDRELPDDVLEYKGRFDIVFLTYGFGISYKDILCEYFVRKNGFICSEAVFRFK